MVTNLFHAGSAIFGPMKNKMNPPFDCHVKNEYWGQIFKTNRPAFPQRSPPPPPYKQEYTENRLQMPAKHGKSDIATQQ